MAAVGPRYFRWLLLLLLPIVSCDDFCWKPNSNPFSGVPEVERLDEVTVRVMWHTVFPNGTGCEDVDFLIKSHPLESPSNYKLSDFTLRGQRSATLIVPPGSDFIFQVIARENKGSGVGIEYAYSRPATSLANPSQEQKDTLRQSIWVAGSNPRTSARATSAPRTSSAPPPRSPEVAQTGQKPRGRTASPYATTTQPPVIRVPGQERTYQKPMLKSLDSNKEYYDTQDELETNPWYIYECVPLLKNLAGFEDGSKKSSILKKYIRHLNENTVQSVETFLAGEKSCRSGYSGRSPGHLVEGEGTSQCCSTPWGDNSPQSVCYDQFARCDGRCIPHDWVADGWPDCLDGADEADMSVDGKVVPYQLGCVQCAGVVLSAGFLCREGGGLTRACVESVLGPGQCNVCIGEYMDLP